MTTDYLHLHLYHSPLQNDFEVDDVILALKNSLLEFLGGRIGSRFHALNGFSATLSERALALVSILSNTDNMAYFFFHTIPPNVCDKLYESRSIFISVSVIH